MSHASTLRFRLLVLLSASLVFGGTCGCGDEGDDAGALASSSVAQAEVSTSARDGDVASSEADATMAPPREPTPELPRALAMACWLPPGSYCDPRFPERSCPAEDTCDVVLTEDDQLLIACLDGENLVPESGFCDNPSGVHCAPGLHCFEGACRSFCCSGADCAQDERCQALMSRFGALGVCVEAGDEPSAPACRPPGGACTQNSHCCSNFCHFDHCH